jgi:hypothetical protein
MAVQPGARVVTAPNRRTPRKVDVRPPMSQLPPIIGLTVLGVVGYLAGESVFADRIHPVHWLVAVAGGLAGLLGGYAVAWVMNR